MFVYHVILLTNQGHTVGPDGPVYLRSPLIFNPDTKKEVWRFISYMLVHSGYFHIAFNVVIQVTINLMNFQNPSFLRMKSHWFSQISHYFPTGF